MIGIRNFSAKSSSSELNLLRTTFSKPSSLRHNCKVYGSLFPIYHQSKCEETNKKKRLIMIHDTDA